MSKTQEHFKLLGLKVKDKVTGFKGVVTSVCFDLYGCIQACIQPEALDPTGKAPDSGWADISRLEILDYNPVMDRPDFGINYGKSSKEKTEVVSSGYKGPAEKPNKPLGYI